MSSGPSVAAPHFKDLFDAADGAALILTPGLTVAAANEAYLRLVGAGRDAIVGRAVFDLFPENLDAPSPGGGRGLRASLERVLASGRADAMGVGRYRVRGAGADDAGVRYLSPLNVPVVDEAGGVTHIVHRLDDVTGIVAARRQVRPADAGRPPQPLLPHRAPARPAAATAAEPADGPLTVANQQLRQAAGREQAMRIEAQAVQAHLEAVLSSIGDAFGSVDRRWRVSYVNARAAALTGAPADALIGGDFWQEFRSLVDHRVERLLRQAMESGAPARFEHWSAALDRWFEFHAYPARAGLSFVALDITRRKTAERRQRFLAELGELLHRTEDPVEVGRLGSAAIGRFLGVLYAAHGDVDDREAVLAIDGSGAGTGAEAVRACALGALGADLVEALRNGRTVAIGDAPDGPWREATGIDARALLAVPLVRRGRLAALLLLCDSGPRHWYPDDILLAEQVAERTWLALDRARAERALRDSERRLRLAADAASLGEFEYDLRSDTITRSPLVDRMFGFEPGEAGPGAAALFARIHPDDIKRIRRHIAVAAAGIAGWNNEYRVVWPDGTVRWLASMGEVVRGADGTPERVYGVLMDQTGRKTAEQALHDSREQLLAALAASETGVFRWSIGSGEMVWDGNLDRMLGLPRQASGHSLDAFLGPVHPADRDAVRDCFTAGRSGDAELAAEFRVVHADGTVRWLQLKGRAAPPGDGEGLPGHVTGACVDITERRRGEDHQRLLVAELSHRVKNTLASVLSIATQTLRTTESVDAFAERFRGRLMALAEAHGLLTLSNWEEARIEDLVAKTFEPYRSGAGDGRIALSGPSVPLRPQMALTLGMVLHELATNAAKYGALAGNGGVVDLSWHIDQAPTGASLVLDWHENAGRSIGRPSRTGFGSSLIRRSVQYELDGEVDHRFLPDGVRCTLRIPLQAAGAVGGNFYSRPYRSSAG